MHTTTATFFYKYLKFNKSGATQLVRPILGAIFKTVRPISSYLKSNSIPQQPTAPPIRHKPMLRNVYILPCLPIHLYATSISQKSEKTQESKVLMMFNLRHPKH